MTYSYHVTYDAPLTVLKRHRCKRRGKAQKFFQRTIRIRTRSGPSGHIILLGHRGRFLTKLCPYYSIDFLSVLYTSTVLKAMINVLGCPSSAGLLSYII